MNSTKQENLIYVLNESDITVFAWLPSALSLSHTHSHTQTVKTLLSLR